MNNLILCKGHKATKPYHFELTNTNIYTIEELCYYVYNNIYEITEAVFDTNLVLWLKNEIGMDEIAGKLENMIKNKNNLKDIVVSILCRADYYVEEQIRRVIETIDAINGLPEALKLKIKADNYLKYGYYSQALTEYEGIINSQHARELSPGAYGDILHNIGIVNLRTAGYNVAASKFKEAYSKNAAKESLLSYLYALKLDKRDEDFEYEIKNYSVTTDMIRELSNNYLFSCDEAKLSENYEKIVKIEKIKKTGKISEFYQQLDGYISDLKEEYREKILVR